MSNLPVFAYKVNNLIGLKPNAFVYLKVPEENKFEIFVTDKEGVPYSLKQNATGVSSISSSDLSIDISGSSNVDIKVSTVLQNLINSALQAGDNISELINDAGYITTANLPDTKAEFNAQLTDGDFLFVGDVTPYTNEDAQDAIGNILYDSTTIDLIYDDSTPNITAKVKVNSITSNELSDSINVSEFINDGSDGTSTYIETDELGITAFTNDYNDLDNLPTSFSNVVYVNSNDPNTATIFDLNNPPSVNDNSLKANVSNLYIGLDSSTWTYNSTTLLYTTYVTSAGSGSNFFISGTAIDAGNNKTSAIKRNGTIETAGNKVTGGTSAQFQKADGSLDSTAYENTVNKKTVIAGNESSTTFFGIIKAWIDWFKDGLASQIPAKSSVLVDNDRIVFFDSADGNKTKYRLWSQIKSNLATVFFLDATSSIQTQLNEKQIIDEQIEIGANSNVLNTWHGKTVLFTANCTITVPSTLNSSLMFPFRTLTGVTVTWAITSPFTWETTPSSTTEKTVGHFMRRGSTNTIFLDT